MEDMGGPEEEDEAAPPRSPVYRPMTPPRPIHNPVVILAVRTVKKEETEDWDSGWLGKSPHRRVKETPLWLSRVG